MDYKKYFLEIVEFISPYEDVLLKEPLDNFEQRRIHYPTEFIDQLRLKKDAEHYRFIHFNCTENLDEKFTSFQKALEDLTNRFVFNETKPQELSSWALWKVSQKKKHEIEQLRNFISENSNAKEIIDIGGGVGHLARILSHYDGINTISIDLNLEFQELGKKRINKYPLPKNAGNISFLNKSFDRELLNQLDYDLSVGLHTCGELAVEHLKCHDKPLINFGCCYHRLDETTFPLSKFCKDNLAFTFSKEAYTLATRSHYGACEKQFTKTKKVKDYRFALSYLLKKHYGREDFFSVGSSVNSTYKSKFSDYAMERLKAINFDLKLSHDELDSFFLMDETQNFIHEIYLCNVFRWRFGRVLELLIILDRAIWLHEQNKKVDIKAVFDPAISPRNLAIFSI